jgi:hypothetical protein
MSSLELKKESKTTQLVPIQCLSKSSNVSTSSNSVRDKSKTRLALKRLLKLVQAKLTTKRKPNLLSSLRRELSRHQ